MKASIWLSALFAALLFGCGDGVDGSIISNGATTSQAELDKIQNIDLASYAEVADVFLNTSHIQNTKPILLVFGANGCIYCEKLKKVIQQSQNLKAHLKEDYLAYYVNLSYNKNHQIDFLNASLNTQELADKYHISPTPTLLFLSPNGKVLFSYPGFMEERRLTKALEYLSHPSIFALSQEAIAKELQERFGQKHDS